MGLCDEHGNVKGYGIKKLGSIAGQSTISGTVDKFYVNEVVNGASYNEYYVNYDDPSQCPPEFEDDISGYTKYVCLMHGNVNQMFSKITETCKDTISGFAFMNTSDHDISSSVMNIKKADEKKLNIHLINNGSDIDASGSNYYVMARIGHSNGDDTVYFAPLDSIPAGESNITISNQDYMYWNSPNPDQTINEKDYYHLRLCFG